MGTVFEKLVRKFNEDNNEEAGEYWTPRDAVCKADMLLKGEGESADHIVGGAEWSTLAHDAFSAQEFDFMLANPPYWKSWKKDLEAMGGKDGMRDPRFKVMHQGEGCNHLEGVILTCQNTQASQKRYKAGYGTIRVSVILKTGSRKHLSLTG